MTERSNYNNFSDSQSTYSYTKDGIESSINLDTSYKNANDLSAPLSRREKDDIINQLIEKYGAKSRTYTSSVPLDASTNSLGFSTNSNDFGLKASNIIQNIHHLNESKISLTTSQYLPPYQNWAERSEYDKYPLISSAKADNSLVTELKRSNTFTSQNSSPVRISTSNYSLPQSNIAYERNPLVDQIIREEKEKLLIRDSKANSNRASPVTTRSPATESRNDIFYDTQSFADTSVVKRTAAPVLKTDIQQLLRSSSIDSVKSFSSYRSTGTPSAKTQVRGKNGFKIVGVLMLILLFRLFIILYLDI